MKLQHCVWVLVFFSGCAQSGWNMANPLAVTKRPNSQALDKKSQSQLSLARLSERHGQIDAARDIYKGILHKYPQNQAANHRLGIVYARQSQFKLAEHHFSKAMETGTLTPELLTDVGYLYYLQERLGDAEQTFRRALELNPNHKPAHNNLAITLGEQGKYDESLNHFRLAVGDAQAIANLAFIQSQMGDEELATQNYHRALTMDPSIKPAAEALVQLTASKPAGPGNPNVRYASFAKRPIQRLPQVDNRVAAGQQNGNRGGTQRRGQAAPNVPQKANPSGFTVTDGKVIPQRSITNPVSGQNWQIPTWSPTNNQMRQSSGQ